MSDAADDRTIAVLAYQALDGAIRTLIATSALLRRALDETRDPNDPEWEPPTACLHVDTMSVTTMGDDRLFCRKCGEEVDA